MSDAHDSAGAGDETHVVTAFCRHRGEVLLLRRSDAVGTYQGQWGGVSGFAEGNPDEQVRVELREETGLEDDAVSLVRSGRLVRFEDDALEDGREWVVHPYLFDVTVDDPEIELSDEHDAFEWVSPTAALEGVDPDIPTVPELWTAYERVAPTVRSITADDDHGAAYLSVRALEVFRDRAGLLVAEREESEATESPRNGDQRTRESSADPAGERDELAELASRLLESPAVLEAAHTGIERALAADDDAAATAADAIDGSVLTLSRSGTVLEALRQGEPSRVFVAESRPAREGVAVAEELAADEELECPISVHTDAAVAHVLATESVDRVVVGADTIRADGAVVNKTGTRAAAIAAAREGIPVTVVAATDKVSTREELNLESGDRSAVYDGDAAIDVLNPTFDVTPADCVSQFATERGTLEADEINSLAEELRDLEGW
ncbi:NUDIX domain-containing protein [Natronolimnobius sp. AArcel1]|uniref:NUDIX domain-containing protein n=1 Tax=Natronolimnobius sp. AArcel1 TaxID=1679093 RepID=UPI0013EAAD7A|nr:NUDIX domain-containing protein [Natronolimnobius sp. AArcel1]NGM70288.1 NUDIX domain-containing protein [Natronolimnobius sp. AArcel1]